MSLAGFPVLSKGMMVAFLQGCGTSVSLKHWLKMDSNSSLSAGPRASHLFDGAVQVIQVEVGYGAIVRSRGLHPSLRFSDAVAFGFGELQFADIRVVGSEGVSFSVIGDDDSVTSSDRFVGGAGVGTAAEQANHSPCSRLRTRATPRTPTISLPFLLPRL